MKKLVSIFLSLALIILQINVVTVFADTTSGDYTYSVSNSTAVITGYKGSGRNVTIPSKIDGYTVAGIGDNAFCGCSCLTSITIPNSVTLTYLFRKHEKITVWTHKYFLDKLNPAEML
ncbi:MAG: hypothetical protein Q8900_07045 [Bacillota bacterium]|nr:hypothetical protein [Bacillota bacterium]